MAFNWRARRKLYSQNYEVVETLTGNVIADFGSRMAEAHKAAASQEMYETLKEWSALDEVMKECGFCADEYIECDIHQGQLQQIIKMRDAALLKAEGREA